MNPEVLSLIKLAAVFAIIIGLLSMKKPLNLVMSIASVVVVVLYAMPSDLVLPALKSGLIGSNTINALLVLYCITYLQRMMESRKQLAGCEEAMNGLFNNRRINASVVPFMLGCLPAASTVLICGPIVRSAVGDSLTTPETAAATSYFRHISEAFMPTYNTILIAITLTNGLVTPSSFVLGMLPVVVCLFISGYVIYLRRIPKETGLVYDEPKSVYWKLLVKSIWPIFLSIAMVLTLNTPVWGAVLVCIVLEFFVQKFSVSEVVPFFRTAFESKLMLNTLAVMVFGNLLRSTGVVDLLPVYLSKLPIPNFLVWSLIFAIGTLVGGSPYHLRTGYPHADDCLPWPRVLSHVPAGNERQLHRNADQPHPHLPDPLRRGLQDPAGLSDRQGCSAGYCGHSALLRLLLHSHRIRILTPAC